MPLFHTQDEAINYLKIPKRWVESVVSGRSEVCQFISNLITQRVKSGRRTCVLAFDGFLGVGWKGIVSPVKNSLKQKNLTVKDIDITAFYRSPDEIEKMVEPCLARNSDFGFVFQGRLKDFFDVDRLEALGKDIKNYKQKKRAQSAPDVVICYGTGAAIPCLRSLYDVIFYIDVTRAELLNRCEKRIAFPLGSGGNISSDPFSRLPYVDYQVLKIHKKYLFKYIHWYIDGNMTEQPKLLPRKVYDGILATIAQYPFRLRPFYIPRIWGGQYLKKIRKLPRSMPGCSFSIEVAPSQQSLRISLGKTVVEIPFLNLVWSQPERILGNEAVRKFGRYFPLTVNYDDTYKGGSLAIQVHPHGTYMRKNFNEMMRHDETYYVVKAWQKAKTYHGLKEGTDLEELYRLCERAEKEKIPFNHDLYINSWPSKSGDLYLLPAGTIHASGANQLVLELDMDGTKNGKEYTFHLYDYLRTDLNGNLRAIHLNHSFNVIKSHRKTSWVAKHLKQRPRLLRSSKDWAEYLLGEHGKMCYKVHRLEFREKIDDDTRGKFHILTLVEGESVIVQSKKHSERKYELNYTETVIVPASIGSYSVINSGESPCKLTKALLK